MHQLYSTHSGNLASRATYSWIGEPTGFDKNKIFFSAVHFGWTNTVVRVGDDVTLQFESYIASRPAVARIESFWFDPSRQVGCLTVRWFYRVQDVPPQVLSHFPLGTPGRNEIFLSEVQGNFEIQSVVIGRAVVVRADSDEGLSKDEYLSRFTFSPERLVFESLKSPQLNNEAIVSSAAIQSSRPLTLHPVPVGINLRDSHPLLNTKNIFNQGYSLQQVHLGDVCSTRSLLSVPTQQSQSSLQSAAQTDYSTSHRLYLTQSHNSTSAATRNRHCTAEGCKRQPSFGFDGQPARYCATHKIDGMANVVSRRCDAPGCTRQPIYGILGEKRPRFCSSHKSPEMIDIKNRRCEASGCTTHPTYGFPGQKRRFCGTHKQDGMKDFKSSRCNISGCSRRPSYAFPNKRASRCSGHKEKGMVDVKHRQCDVPNCSRRVESKRRSSLTDTTISSLQADSNSAPIRVYCTLHQDVTTPLESTDKQSPRKNAFPPVSATSTSHLEFGTSRASSPTKFSSTNAEITFQNDRAPLGSVNSPHAHRRTAA